MDRIHHLIVGRLWLQHWPYQSFLPRHLEPAEEQEPDDGRISGLIDEAN